MSRLDPILIDQLRNARRVAVLTGAGVSAESGIPTFRDQQTGLWQRSNAEELATPGAFRRDPSLVWGWYEWRRKLVQRAQPNPAHEAIAAMHRKVQQLDLITQNVDDLHERAGSPDVRHLHGELSRPYCEACRRPYMSPNQREIDEAGERIEPPLCGQCGGRVRPGVVWFGEELPAEVWRAAQQAAADCDVFLCVGTSSLVWPAASLIQVAIGNGAVTAQVNPNVTGIDSLVQFTLKAPAGVILPQLVREAWEEPHP